MASIIEYDELGFQIISPEPTAAGAALLQANIKLAADLLADRPTIAAVGQNITTQINTRPSFDQVSNAIDDAIAALELGTASTHAASDFQPAGSYVTTTSLTTSLASYVTTANLTWANVTGKPTFAAIATSGSAADLTAGTVPLARLSASSGSAAGTMSAAHFTLLTNATSSATGSTLVMRSETGVINGTFAGSGGSITSLNASNFASGTVADARLSSNVPLRNAANIFSAAQTIENTLTLGTTSTDGVIHVNGSGGLQILSDLSSTAFRLLPFYNDLYFQNTGNGSIIFGGGYGGATAGNVVFKTSARTLVGDITDDGSTKLQVDGAASFRENSSAAPLNLTQENVSGPQLNFAGAAPYPAYGGMEYVPAYGIPVAFSGELGGPNYGNPLYIMTYEEDCFLAGTPVLTPDGYKAIETLQPGDKVISMDEGSRFTFVNEVVQLLTHKPSPIGYLIINEKLSVTPNHKIYINDQWQPIGTAKLGDYLIDKDGKRVWIYSIEKRAEQVVSYNIKVQAAAKNYFAHDLLVHNKCPFLYVFKDGEWIYQNTFLFELDAPEKETVQRRKLRTLMNEFVIREIEPETSYIKNLTLIAITPDGETRLAWTNRIENLVTTHGDYVKVSFEPLPPNTTEVWIEAEGYYTWQGD